MHYGNVLGVDKKVSRIVFGCAGQDMWKGKDASPLLDAALGLGINTFDTARVYGKSEQTLGKWLKNQNRNELVIITKGCHPTPFGKKRVNRKELLKDLEISLNTLQTDYIDIYLLHRDDERIPTEELVETLNECKRQGKIHAFGGSNWSHQRIEEANRYALSHSLSPFTCSSPHFSLAKQSCDPWGGGCVSIAGDPAARDWYETTQMPVFAYSPLSHGLLSGKVVSDQPHTFRSLDKNTKKSYLSEANLQRLGRLEKLAKAKNCGVAQLSLAWIFAQKLNVFSLTGTSGMERLKENLGALSIRLTEKESAWLNLESETCAGR